MGGNGKLEILTLRTPGEKVIVIQIKSFVV
jgi:hypothetical protein